MHFANYKKVFFFPSQAFKNVKTAVSSPQTKTGWGGVGWGTGDLAPGRSLPKPGADLAGGGRDSRSSSEEASDRAVTSEGRPQAGAKPGAPRRGPAASPHRRLTAEPALGVGASPGGSASGARGGGCDLAEPHGVRHAEGSQRAPHLGRLSGLNS